MKAIVVRRYGAPELKDVDRPQLTEDGVLVRVRAASINRIDWYMMAGVPYLVRLPFELRQPRNVRLGSDFAGTVEAVGGAVTDFRPGDDVFGMATGTLAEFVAVPAAGPIVLKPVTLTLEQAAALPLAALTALQGLRDKGQLQPGQKVLVNGASGGVGTFAVQLAKALGAEVTAVCSTRNVETATSLGADRVIDYTREDFTRGDDRYDLLFDNAGSRSWTECRRVLTPKATMVLVGGPKDNRLLGPVAHMAGVRLRSLGASQRIAFFVAQRSKAVLALLGELSEAGKLTAIVDRTYRLDETADALQEMGRGHTRGKLVITM